MRDYPLLYSVVDQQYNEKAFGQSRQSTFSEVHGRPVNVRYGKSLHWNEIWYPEEKTGGGSKELPSVNPRRGRVEN